MEYRALGSSGLRISVFTMGTKLDKVSAPPLISPYWHQAKTASDRLSPADLTLLGPYV